MNLQMCQSLLIDVPHSSARSPLHSVFNSHFLIMSFIACANLSSCMLFNFKESEKNG